MSGSAVADEGVVSAVCSSFKSEGGQRLKEKLQFVARQHGNKRQSMVQGAGTQQLNNEDTKKVCTIHVFFIFPHKTAFMASHQCPRL